MLVLLQQHCAHQSLDRSVVREDSHHTGAAFNFLIDALEQVGAPHLLPVLGREVAECQHVLAGLDHQLSRAGELGSEHGADLIPLLQHRLLALLREHRAQRGGDHLLVGFWHRLEQVSGVGEAFRGAVMDAAQAAQRSAPRGATPAAALQHPANGVGEALVGIADHELDPAETAFLLLRRSLRLEGAKKLAPEGLALAVAHLEAEQLAPAIGVHAHGDDDGSGADLQRPAEERLHLQVDVGADAADLGFGDPALAAQSRHQGVDLAGGDAGDIGLHHHGVEGLIHTPAGLEDRGQEAAAAQLGDP